MNCAKVRMTCKLDTKYGASFCAKFTEFFSFASILPSIHGLSLINLLFRAYQVGVRVFFQETSLGAIFQHLRDDLSAKHREHFDRAIHMGECTADIQEAS